MQGLRNYCENSHWFIYYALLWIIYFCWG